MEFVITSSQIVGFCSLIVAIWGVWKIVKETTKPNDDLKELVDNHSRMLDNDNKRLKEVEESNNMILQCLLVIINHEITGNSTDKLKDTHTRLEKYLIER